MLKITPVLPPRTEEALKPALEKLHAAASALGVQLDLDGFVRSWLTDSTRVVVAYDGDTPKAFAIMAFGRRYYDAHMSASVILAEGPERAAMLEFLLEMAKVLGAEVLFYEARDGDTIGGEVANMKMVQVI